MESHNGLSNGVNGITVVSEVEPVETPLEVKSIPNISVQSETVQDEVSQPVIVETVKEQDVAQVQAEIIEADITVEQEPATPQAEEVTNLPLEVTANIAVKETLEVVDVPVAVEVIVPAAVEINVPATEEVIVPGSTEISGESTVVSDASPQPQVILETPEITQEVKDVGIEEPITKVSAYQPGTADFQVPQYAIDALNRIAKDEGFTNYAISYDRGSKFGDGFIAEIVRAKIIGNQLVKGVQEESELVLVLKLPPENKTRREQMGMKVFERGVTVYNEILPMFQKFQLDKGLKPGQGFVSFPKCYYASFDAEKDESVIIMEDIRLRGFKMLNKYKTVDYPHATAVLETIAQLHGLSLAMKDQCPGLFNKFKGLKDSMSEEVINNMMKTIIATNCEKAIATLEPHEEHIKQKLRAFGENVFDIIKTCTDGELSEPYSVINHGDCWTNNIMFKYERGSPRHLCLLDWQITRYVSPVLDICYFLYQCTDSALRAQHFDNLVQGYHIALRKQVELLGSDVSQILPFTALLREMKNKAKFALSTAIFIIPMLCVPNAELPNMDDMVESLVKGAAIENDEMFQMSANTAELYRQRMSGIVRDMYKKGYL